MLNLSTRLPRRWRRAGRLLSYLAVSVLATAALACSDDTSDTVTSSSAGSGATGAGGNGSGGMAAGTGGNAMGSGGMVNGDYPAGPYGNEVGDTLAYLEFSGFLSPDGAAMPSVYGEYVDYSMLDIKNSGSPFVLIHLAAMF